MSASIPETMLLSDLLKPTGFDCPEELLDKTFAEATAGGDVEVESNKAALFAWKLESAVVYTKTGTPTTSTKALVPSATAITESAIAAVADEFASITIGEDTYTRYTSGDIAL